MKKKRREIGDYIEEETGVVFMNIYIYKYNAVHTSQLPLQSEAVTWPVGS